MAESPVVTALVSKRAEMAGLIEHYQKEMGRLAADLAHLDATLKLFSPEIDLRTLRAKEHRTRNRFFRPGECQRMVLDIFREAQGAALSSRQIGETLAARKGLEPTTAMIEQMQKNAIAVVHRLERTGTLISAGRGGQGATWRVACRLHTAMLSPCRRLPCQYPHQSRLTRVRAHLPTISRKIRPLLQRRVSSRYAISLA